ncbi:hypothetical protein H6P81_011642 [Aristolochia fimbriata]|uniref:Retrotransposon gag domain-containing protein n=1 Tax=Aristolochia fimbriata TaxID=158543 RepID=A0AAV7EA55_ARIFI|nr:hypothetical protein H6P81_011642 [Aristolochia fimbriata]
MRAEEATPLGPAHAAHPAHTLNLDMAVETQSEETHGGNTVRVQGLEDVYGLGGLYGVLGGICMRVVGIERLVVASPVMQDFSVKVEHDKGASASETVTTGAAVSTQAREPHESKPTRVKVPEPKVYDGVRHAKVIDNFLWQVEEHLKASGVNEEVRKVKGTTLFLAGDALLWWRRNALDGGTGTSSIRTWSEFKVELKKRFCPTNVEHEAYKKLLLLKHSGKTLADVLSAVEKLTEFEKRSEDQNSDAKDKGKKPELKATEDVEGEKKIDTR